MSQFKTQQISTLCGIKFKGLVKWHMRHTFHNLLPYMASCLVFCFFSSSKSESPSPTTAPQTQHTSSCLQDSAVPLSVTNFQLPAHIGLLANSRFPHHFLWSLPELPTEMVESVLSSGLLLNFRQIYPVTLAIV